MAGVVELLAPVQRLVLILASEEQPVEVLEDLDRVLQGRGQAPVVQQPHGEEPGAEEVLGEVGPLPEHPEAAEREPTEQHPGLQPRGDEAGAEEVLGEEGHLPEHPEAAAPEHPEDAELEPTVQHPGSPLPAQAEPLPRRETGRRAAARQAEELLRQAGGHLSPPKRGGRRMRRL